MATFKLDLGGLAELLQSPKVAAVVLAEAEGIASRVVATAHDGPVPVNVHPRVASGMRVPRAAADVVLAHPGGLAIEAKHGPLMRALGGS